MISLSLLLLCLAVLCKSYEAAATYNSVCEDVFPHISLGLGYSTQAACQAVGGCWDSSAPADSLSACYSPKIYGYSFKETSSKAGQLSGKLTLIKPSGVFGPDFSFLNVVVTVETATRLNIKVTPTDESGKSLGAWEVPQSVVPRSTGEIYNNDQPNSAPTLRFRVLSEPFEVIVLRDNEPIFFLSKMTVFQEQYLQMVFGSSAHIMASYGFGESTRLAQKLSYNTPYTLWNTDYWAAAEGAGNSLYGSHPFYLQVTDTGSAHGVLLMNSNAMEAVVSQSEPESGTDRVESAVSIQSTGGIIDLYIFSGPSPLDVVKQYQELVGRPYLVPFWSLGKLQFYLCCCK